MRLVRGYQLLLSPWLGNNCRFVPSCSQYALESLDRHGAAAGAYLALRRLARCGPWCDGGCDPVPAELPRAARLFSRLAPRPGPGGAGAFPSSPEKKSS
ncbi:MAG: membrane protein insertion efficiency factor YidD [Xylophilus ampelinus]